MRPTANHVRAAYTMLRALPPFCRWSLPAPERMAFGVNSHRDEYGHYHDEGGHRIEVSRVNVKTVAMLVQIVAHEMIHLRQTLTQADTQHNPAFMRASTLVCRGLGFNRRTFV